MARLAQQLLHWSEDDGPNCSMVVGIVDATEQICNRPKIDQREFYSGKSKCHVFKSQIVVEPRSGRIIHIFAG